MNEIDLTPMIGNKALITWIENLKGVDEKIQAGALKRLNYVLRKEFGAKPKFHKGKYGSKYDNWTCGNCGVVLSHGVTSNYCNNCGYSINWENPRCLTGCEDEDCRI